MAIEQITIHDPGDDSALDVTRNPQRTCYILYTDGGEMVAVTGKALDDLRDFLAPRKT